MPTFVPLPAPSIIRTLAKDIVMEIAGMMGLQDNLRGSSSDRASLRAGLATGLKRHRLLLTYDRVSGRGATRVTLVGRVRMEALSYG